MKIDNIFKLAYTPCGMCVPSNMTGKFGVVNNQKPKWRATNYDVVTRINILTL